MNIRNYIRHYSVTKFFTAIFIMAISMLYSINASAADATLSWYPSNDPTVFGYKIHYGMTSGSYGHSINVGNQTTYTVSGLGNGTYYFAVTAYDASGNQSAFSNEASKTFTGVQASDTSSSSGGNVSGGCGMIFPVDHDGGSTPRLPMDFVLLTAVMLWFGVFRKIKRSMFGINAGSNWVDIRGNGGVFLKELGGLNS